MQWKTDPDEGLQSIGFKIVAVDVKSLYPSLSRDLVKRALSDSLNRCTDYNNEGKQTLTDLVLFCLENTIIRYNNTIYKQTRGIPTGENHSVSLANIAMHYIVMKLDETNTHTFIFRRFIDDIIYITKDGCNV